MDKDVDFSGMAWAANQQGGPAKNCWVHAGNLGKFYAVKDPSKLFREILGFSQVVTHKPSAVPDFCQNMEDHGILEDLPCDFQQ